MRRSFLTRDYVQKHYIDQLIQHGVHHIDGRQLHTLTAHELKLALALKRSTNN